MSSAFHPLPGDQGTKTIALSKVTVPVKRDLHPVLPGIARPQGSEGSVPRGEDGPREKHLLGEAALGTSSPAGRTRERGFLMPCPPCHLLCLVRSPSCLILCLSLGGALPCSSAPTYGSQEPGCCSCLCKGASVSCWEMRGWGDGGVKDGRQAPSSCVAQPEMGQLSSCLLTCSLGLRWHTRPGNQARFSLTRPATSLPASDTFEICQAPQRVRAARGLSFLGPLLTS